MLVAGKSVIIKNKINIILINDFLLKRSHFDGHFNLNLCIVFSFPYLLEVSRRLNYNKVFNGSCYVFKFNWRTAFSVLYLFYVGSFSEFEIVLLIFQIRNSNFKLERTQKFISFLEVNSKFEFCLSSSVARSATFTPVMSYGLRARYCLQLLLLIVSGCTEALI